MQHDEWLLSVLIVNLSVKLYERLLKPKEADGVWQFRSWFCLRQPQTESNCVEVRTLPCLIRERVTLWQDLGRTLAPLWTLKTWACSPANVDCVWNWCYFGFGMSWQRLSYVAHDEVSHGDPCSRPPADGPNPFLHADLFEGSVYRYRHYMHIQGQTGGNCGESCHPVSVVFVMFWLKGTAYREGQPVSHNWPFTWFSITRERRGMEGSL